MKKSNKKYLAIIFVAGVIITSILSPVLWLHNIENYLNNSHFNSQGWNMKIKKLSGNLLHTMRGHEIVMTHTSGAHLLISDFHINFRLVSLLWGRKTINQITFENVIYVTAAIKDSSKSIKSFNLNLLDKINFKINNIAADGHILTAWQDSLKTLKFYLAGELSHENRSISIQLDSLSLYVEEINLGIFLKESRGIIKPSGMELNMGACVINEFPFKGNINYQWSERKKITADLSFINYKLPQKLFSRLPLQPKLSSLDADFHFESDLEYFEGNLDISNELGLDMSGKFSLQRFPSHLFLDNLLLKGNNTSILMSGTLENDGQFKGTFQLDNFDMSQWLYEGRTSQLSGYILGSGGLKNKQINSLDLTVEVNESKLYSKDNISLSGSLSLFDNILSIDNPVVFSIGPSRIEVTGKSDFIRDSLDLNLELNDASTFLINNFWSDSLTSGQATGSLHIGGNFNELTGTGNLIFNDFGYRNISLDYFNIYGNVKQTGKTVTGSVKTKFGRGTWNEYGFESGNGNLSISQNDLELTDFELRNKRDFLHLSAKLQAAEHLVLEKLQIAYKDHYLITPDTIYITLADSGFILDPFELHIDDGIIKGFLKTLGPRRGRLKFSNIPAEIISLVEIDIGYKIDGSVFGEITLEENNDNLDYGADLRITDGEIANQPFDDLLLSAYYRNGIIYINEFTLTSGKTTGLQVSGSIPLIAGAGNVLGVNLNSNFKRINMLMVTQFIPEWFYLEGVISGDFNISGNTQKTALKFNGQIENSVFDKIYLGTVSANLDYDGQRLNLKNISSKYGQSTITGGGSIPIDLNFGSDQFGRYIAHENFDLSMHGNLDNFNLLSTYLTDVDSIMGDIELELKINGPSNNLIRNGKIKINNSTVYTILMDEPIRAITAQAVIIDNNLNINNFSGRLFNSNINKSKTGNSFTIRGGMNMKKFFRPKFNLQIEGKEIFYRSLARDMEALVDLNLHMTGKDTLDFEGIIAVSDGILFTEFDANDILEETHEKSRIISNYNIRFPIKDTFTISNSRIDADIRGEISMSKKGFRPWDYYGEIEFIKGKIYYLVGGDVFENLIGRMTFDGNGFNPFLDLSASTRIGQTMIRLAVYGPMENPQWIFDSDQGLTESDILQLLTFHTRLSDEGITAKGLGTQAQSILGSFLERQFEKNFVRVSGLQNLGVENVSISGTNSLISEESGEEFAITAKMNEKIYFNFNYRRSFGFNRPGQNRIGVEYKLNPYFSLVGNVDEYGEMHMKLRLKYSY